VAFTALALSRFSKAQVVPEDDTKGMVNLNLQQVSFDKAVSKVAGQVHRKWTRVYTLQPLNATALVRQSLSVTPTIDANGQIDTNQIATTTNNNRVLPPDLALEALVSTMTPEERQQTLEQIASAGQGSGGGGSGGDRQQQGAMSPAAQAAAAAAQEDMESRIENRLKNGTIDQRLAHDRRTLNNPQGGTKP